jgi:hypothetical protein
LKKLLDHVDNANIDLTDEAYSALEDGLGATKEALLPNADDFLPEGMTPEDFGTLKGMMDPNASDADIIKFWEDGKRLDPEGLEETLELGRRADDFDQFLDDSTKELEDLLKGPVEGDIPGISEPNIIDEIIKGGDSPTTGSAAAFDNQMADIFDNNNLKDFNAALRKNNVDFTDLQPSINANVYEELAGNAEHTKRLFTEATVDDLSDFMDGVFDSLEWENSLVDVPQEKPILHSLMTSLVKEELAAKAVMGEAAFGGLKEAKEAFAVFDEVLFPEIPTETLRANMRQIFTDAHNESEALRLIWQVERGR